MLSFHNDPLVKAKYLARVKAHERADQIVQQLYWVDGKGCAIGCTMHDSNHHAYETELGLPEWLAYVEESLFEGMSVDDAKAFPRQFLEAIPVGVDVDSIRHEFLRDLLIHPDIGVLHFMSISTSRDFVTQVAQLHQKAIDGVPVPEDIDTSRLRGEYHRIFTYDLECFSDRCGVMTAKSTLDRFFEHVAVMTAKDAHGIGWSQPRTRKIADHLLHLLASIPAPYLDVTIYQPDDANRERGVPLRGVTSFTFSTEPT